MRRSGEMHLNSSCLEPQPAGRNLILVAHGNNLQGLNMLHGYDLPGIAEAEAVVLRPRPGARAELFAAVKGEDWRATGHEPGRWAGIQVTLTLRQDEFRRRVTHY